MPLYTPQEATLGTLEGRGYAFTSQTHRGKQLQGVFFGSEEHLNDLTALCSKDKVRFDGVIYNKNKSGKITKKTQSFFVDVQDVHSVHAGERADFVVLEEI